MGVRACNRTNCDSIMCDKTDGHYYICEDCLNELINLGRKTDIKKFMESCKPSLIEREANKAYFNAIFKDL
jgi:hypothetical protein